MLFTLSIKNYALIDQLYINFDNGFSVITGETGAGKSILLGGLGLILGKRADLSSLRDKESKCIIEAEFKVGKYDLESFYEENDLDYEALTIIRREILPSGKSRAFINDSPVTLGILTELGKRLIDVHSQHQTLQLTDNDYQLKFIDALADNKEKLTQYQGELFKYNKLVKELSQLKDFQENATKEQDYDSFLLKELESAPLKSGIQEELEIQYEQLNNVEIIIEELSKGNQLLNDEQIGAVALLSELKQVSGKLISYGNQFQSINERIQSVFIEIDDISSELETIQEGIEANPKLLEEVNTKLQLLYDLQKKHQVNTVEELIKIKEDLALKVSDIENIEHLILEKETELKAKEEKLETFVKQIRNKRNKIIPSLKTQLIKLLVSLGMIHTSFKIEVNPSPTYKSTGKDDLVFLFSANKGTEYGEIKKVASGGEMSRIMLAIKSILAQYEQLPTIMFDEIDTGVSGEISNRMGEIMEAMSSNMQVFSITHLPQVAAMGAHHYKVYKDDKGAITHTQIKKLEQEDRVVELAEMLGGKNLSDSAIAHAKELLN